MYVRVFEGPGQLQDIEEQKRRIEEFGRRLALVKEKFGKTFNPFLGEALPQSVLKRAGFTTERWADGKAPALIQTALEQSNALRPFIANKLGKVDISKNYHHYRSDPEFVNAYVKLRKISGPFDSQKALTDHVRAYFDPPTDSIHLRPHTHFGQVLKLVIIKFSSPKFRGFFGASMAEGAALYFTNLVLKEQGLERMKPVERDWPLNCAEDLVNAVGLDLVGRAYFENHTDLLHHHLRTKLSIGPVGTEEIAGGALCKTVLLRTATFANHMVKNMVGVGRTNPRSVQIWMRTEIPGVHELQIKRGSGGARSVRITIRDGQDGDNTAVITYPEPAGPPLDPLTRYQYSIIRTGDGKLVGKGSFETPPIQDSDTPKKVVIGLWSCHQPFTERGTISLDAARMLRVLPKILQDNDVKFILPCGDQMYADSPGIFSLFKNPYLIRHAVPRLKNLKEADILKCTDKEVRRLYGLRYRMFWSMPAIREMYANYPSYPMLDDHEIKDNWGNDPKHSEDIYKNVKKGALDAYRDYQASSVLAQRPALGMRKQPGSFHYDFSYGNIGVFVMDIRSQRYNLPPRGRQMFSPAQFDDLQLFLRNNSRKKVLLIVSSVPVVFVPGGLADVGAKHKPDTFFDHWSHSSNRPARDKLLSLLHAHQQAHPNQRVALACGDVHIGNAYSIHWRGGNKPRLYQFTSSALTARESRMDYRYITAGQEIATWTTVDCPPTPFGGPCSGRIDHLPGGKNPFIGPNIGLIEIQRDGDVSNLKFKLMGYHPKEDRPVTYFESGWLG
jgi:alkaline phosphatase D